MKSVLFIPESNRDWDRIRMFVNEHYSPADIFRTHGEGIGWDDMKGSGGGVMFINTHSDQGPPLNRVLIGKEKRLRENEVGLEAQTTSQLTNVIYRTNRVDWERHRIITDTLVEKKANSVTHEMEIRQIKNTAMGVVMNAGIGDQTALMMFNPLLSSMSVGDQIQVIVTNKTKE